MVQTTQTINKEEKKKEIQEVSESIKSSIPTIEPVDSIITEENSEITEKLIEKEEIDGEKSSSSPTEIKKINKTGKSAKLLPHLNIQEMTADELRSEIRIRDNKRNNLLDDLRDWNKERNNFKQIRDRLNIESMEQFKKVSEIKIKRDETNKDIRELKQMRKSVLEELKSFSNRQKEIFERLKNGEESRNNAGNPRRIIQEIDDLEWKLQTTARVTLDEERQFMERIDILSSSLESAESTVSVQKEINDIRKSKSTLKIYLDDSWKQLNELVSASQSRHKRLSELYEIGKKSKQEADKNHKLFLGTIDKTSGHRKQLRNIRAELDILYPRYKELQQQRKKKSDIVRQNREGKVKDAKTKELKEKLSSKKGLSMEEMKFLMENKIIDLRDKK